MINRINRTNCVVVEMHDMAAPTFWCGAESFIERCERKPRVTAPGRRAVAFTADPAVPGPVPDMLDVDLRRTGQMLKACQPRGFCRDAVSRSRE